MADIDSITQATRDSLGRVAIDLQERFRGTFGLEFP
jgi:hypothetical protein